ncbi:1-deoxy-D-xylulose-5-phosphate synthase [Sporobacter termitidis DSM 10068]|uniref:1-deoxy-D-xylulose-5-phosphate synthase n=1 Tax=Sporobacter termitidis DSM 10068 TaxID=1123282 RepID=A0A1M5Y7R9_9FIRM|nr:1-deoxy-D-xylulose-5-phosphate synthase [Sporobacter termitidis]SHI08135.1 1-deoxy-D-xylulose-5-phosphate synthase [Sporobacter termitidis DSM 10068]
MDILDKVYLPTDIKKLNKSELDALCQELRQFMIQSVSKTGGHLASNLGIVELTVAIHRVFDTARDRLVFDVGHQSYVHKILTGRMDRFNTLRQFGGLSGFPRPSESMHDAFIAGHASNSISVALGMARSRTLTRREYSVIALIGDGALTGGLAYEALSDAGESGEPLIIILNDNGMSITPNVGGIAKYLSRQRLKPSYAAFKKRYRRIMEKLPGGRHVYNFTHGIKSAFKEALLHCSMFEEMGLQYAGPIDGHDITKLAEALSWAKSLGEPVLIHVITQKGKGYSYSEATPDVYHGVNPFDYKKGVIPVKSKCFSSVFGEEMVRLAHQDFRVCAVTAAMTGGTGLTDFAAKYPERFYDVGIAEGHGAAMSAGMASQVSIPVFAVYSTFLQRSYDMLLHDVALQNLHVVFAIDRAGLVPGDGETHQGIYDVGYLATVPNMKVLCPASYKELREMLRHAALKMDGPVAVRYPKSGEGRYKDGGVKLSKLVAEGTDLTLVTYGVSVNTALDAADLLRGEGISAEIIKLDFIKPIDYEAVNASLQKTGRLLVLEEAAESGAVGEKVAAHVAASGIRLKGLRLLNLGCRFIPQGSVEELRKMCGIDTLSVRAAARDLVLRGGAPKPSPAEKKRRAVAGGDKPAKNKPADDIFAEAPAEEEKPGKDETPEDAPAEEPAPAENAEQGGAAPEDTAAAPTVEDAAG